jgi:hypothetical protein
MTNRSTLPKNTDVLNTSRAGVIHAHTRRVTGFYC